MLTESCLKYLKDLIQINTTNPPGNEIEAINYIKSLFDEHGISYKILESSPGRANIVARIKGDGSKRPLILTSHVDVVPAEASHWKTNPFSAEVIEGELYGRGAVDMKNHTAMTLAVFLKLKQDQTSLKRDVIFIALADEEAGTVYGSKWLCENHAHLFNDAEYALNEGGGFSLDVEGQTFYPIGVSEKGFCWFDLLACGTPGHGSMPHSDQAVTKLSEAALKLSQNKFQFRTAPSSTDFMKGLAQSQSGFKKFILNQIPNPTWHNLILNKLFPDRKRAKQFWNLFHNTACPTKLNAGCSYNVLPSTATLGVDGRIHPGSNLEEFKNEIKNLVGPELEMKVHLEQPPSETDYKNDPFYTLLCQTITKADPSSKAIPFMLTGFSDSTNYRKLGIKCYGFAPIKLPPGTDFSSLFHAHNERIPIKGLEFGVNVLWDAVKIGCVK